MGNALKAGVALAALSVTLILALVIVAAGTSSSAAPQSGACVATGVVPTLSLAQSSNAETIVAVALGLDAGERGAQIALMTAYTESTLENLGPETDNDGSLGLFQQRVAAGWGTAAQEQDPTDATTMFVDHLLAVTDWQSIAPWTAAQDAQASGFADGSNYEVNWVRAGSLLDVITGLADGGDCGGENGAEPAGPASPFGLPTDYSIPSDATSAETLAITYAISKLGDAYVWGAAGPDSFDCSGLTMMAWAQAGVRLDHYTGDQLRAGTGVAGYGVISPGDLVLIPGSDGTLANPGHVGIYIGYGLVLSATDPQQGVIVQTWVNFTAGRLSGIRHLG